MASAATLKQAAGQSFDNLFTIWVGGGTTLRDKLALFAREARLICTDSNPGGRPVANWATTIAAFASSIVVTFRPDRQVLSPAADYVYRICWLASSPTLQSPRISAPDQAALLAAYNATF